MLNLIRKDLLRRLRSPLATLVMIAFPLFMSAAIGSISSGGGGQDFPVIDVLIENRDEDGFLAETLLGALGQDEMKEYFDARLVGPEGEQMMVAGKASAMVILPENFTNDVLQGVTTEIEVVRNPAEGIGPEIVYQGTQVVATYLDQGARLLGGELGAIQAMIDADEMPAAAKVGALAAGIMEHAQAAEIYLFPPLVKIGSVKESEEEEEDSGGGNVYGYILVMTTVMALMFVATRSLGDFFDEQNSGMLRRQMATPVGIERVIAAKMIFAVVFGVFVLLVLAVIGLSMRWIRPPIALDAVLALAVSFSLAASGFFALIIGLARNEKQAGILGWLVIMGMSALGGSMVPLQQMPAAMRAAAPLTMNYWAIDGFIDVIFSGAGLGDVLKNVAILLGIGAVASAAAWALLLRRIREMTT